MINMVQFQESETQLQQRIMARLRRQNMRLVERNADLEQRIKDRPKPRKPTPVKKDWRMPDPPHHCCGELMRPGFHNECVEYMLFHQCRICGEIDESAEFGWPFTEDRAWNADFAALGFIED